MHEPIAGQIPWKKSVTLQRLLINRPDCTEQNFARETSASQPWNKLKVTLSYIQYDTETIKSDLWPNPIKMINLGYNSCILSRFIFLVFSMMTMIDYEFINSYQGCNVFCISAQLGINLFCPALFTFFPQKPHFPQTPFLLPPHDISRIRVRHETRRCI